MKKAARKASGKQASRAESTFRQQPKATKQPKMTREQRKKQLVPYEHSMEIAHRPMQILILGHDFPEEEEAKAYGKKLKKERREEKKRRTKASGGSRQSQKRRQGNY